MLVPGRYSTANDYRYGFQGQEKDNEIKGEGNSLNYTFRMHDPRVGRFFAVDPLAPKYPHYSPYAFSGNRVIDMVELEGLEPAEPGTAEGQKGMAFDQSLITDNPGAALKFPFSYQEWTWHSGTKTTAAGWQTKDNYKQIVMPFAIDVAQSQGYRAAMSWQGGRDLYNTITAPPSEVSEETKHFLTSRVWAGQSSLDEISKIGISTINKHNAALYTSAMGIAVPMEFSSPFFGAGLGLRGFATGEAAVSTEAINLASQARTTHIIAGDMTGGGHAWFGSIKSFMNGISGQKSMFPATWSCEKIMQAVSEVTVNNPWIQQTGKAGAQFTKNGAPVRYTIEGVYQGTKLRVVTTADEIITAFPIR